MRRPAFNPPSISQWI